MSKATWTLFGTGYFVNDIFDAVEARNEQVTHIILNQKIDKARMDIIPKNITIQKIDDFKPHTTYYFFSFINPNKKPILDIIKHKKIVFSNLIHPFSYISKSSLLGQGNFVGAGAVVGPNVKMGNFNTINRTASLGHDIIMGNHNHVGPGVTITGRCKIGDKNFFGAGSTVIDGRIISDDIIIGAGAVVVTDLVKPGTYVGVPAKKLFK